MFDWESCQKQRTGADVVRSADLIVDQNAPVRAEGSGPQKARPAFTYIYVAGQGSAWCGE